MEIDSVIGSQSALHPNHASKEQPVLQRKVATRFFEVASLKRIWEWQRFLALVRAAMHSPSIKRNSLLCLMLQTIALTF
jgi:hypothetical protein